jgi:hypothetical protein
MYSLPKSLTVCGKEYEIRSDFREILDIIEILNDEELVESERAFVTLLFFYPEFEDMPPEDYQEALEQCFWFINGGKHEAAGGSPPPRLMDWQQDFPYIIAPVNRVIGHEIRADDYLHWWTFLSAYMEIGECTFAQIVHIREAKTRGRKLDASDQEWYRRNRDIVDLKTKYTTEEEELLKKWGGG